MVAVMTATPTDLDRAEAAAIEARFGVWLLDSSREPGFNLTDAIAVALATARRDGEAIARDEARQMYPDFDETHARWTERRFFAAAIRQPGKENGDAR